MQIAFLLCNKAVAIARHIFALLLALSVTALAQENVAPPPQSEMQKWIAATDAQWQAAFNRDVTDVVAAEFKKLGSQYVASLETAIAKASGAGDLDGAVALRNEQKRFAETNVFPEQDLGGEAASVKQIRAAIRTQLAKLDKDNAARTKALHAKYDQVLAQAQTQLTQRQRLDDALLVKAKREEVSAAWLTSAILTALEKSDPASATGAQKPPVPARGVVTPKPATALMATLRRIVFKASVDAGDNVVIQNGKLHIEHIDWTKPKDISVNGIKWEPNWQDKITDEFTKFTPPLAPFAGAHVAVTTAKKVKKGGYVKVLEQPTDANGQKLIVHLQDEGGGASDFEIHITW